VKLLTRQLLHIISMHYNSYHKKKKKENIYINIYIHIYLFKISGLWLFGTCRSFQFSWLCFQDFACTPIIDCIRSILIDIKLNANDKYLKILILIGTFYNFYQIVYQNLFLKNYRNVKRYTFKKNKKIYL